MAGDDAPPVKARGLVKRYDDVLAVDHIDLNVQAGDVYGFLGPNGAGKTTTLRMALGLITPSEGTVELFGRDPLRHGARALQGVAGFVEAPRFYPYLSARKNLELLAALDGDGARERIAEVFEIVELTARAKHRVGGFSHGMRQRLGIAAALLRRPRLLDPRRACDGARSGRDARHAPADPSSRRRRDHGPAVEPSAAGGPGTVRSRRDRRLTGASSTRARLPICAARAAPAIGCARATTRARSSSCAKRPASSTRASASTASASRPTSTPSASCRWRSRAKRIAILALTPELATLEDLFFRLTEGGEDGSGNGAAERGNGAAPSATASGAVQVG